MRNMLIILLSLLVACSAFLIRKDSADRHQSSKTFSPPQDKIRRLNFFDAKKYLDAYEKNKKCNPVMPRTTRSASHKHEQRKLDTYAKF